MNNKIKIRKSDWLYNAGIVGLVNALELNKDEVKIYKNHIEIDVSVLDGFEEKYFNYLSYKYIVFTSWYRISSFKNVIDIIKENESYDKDSVDKINNQIEFLKKKLVSNSYIKAYGNIDDKDINLVEKSKLLKKVSKKKNETYDSIKDLIDEQLKIIEEIIEFIDRDNVKRHLIAKDFAYTIIQDFWSEKSFLHKSKSDADVYEEFNNYFINGIKDYILEDKSKAKYSCFSCDSDMNKINKSHNLAWIKNIGADGEKKASHFWGLNREDFICPVCNLIYSCIPLGFTYLKGNGFFINNNSSIKALTESNKFALKSDTKILELECKSLMNIANSFVGYEMKHIDKKLTNIQIVKLDTTRVSAYTFNTLSKDVVSFLSRNIKSIEFLLNKKVLWYTDSLNTKHYVYLYKEVVDSIYNNQNLFQLIDFTMNKLMRNEFKGFEEAEVLLKLNSRFLEQRRNEKLNIDDKKIYKMKYLGNELRTIYQSRNANTKLTSISYRLLSAIKLKDTGKFMDTILNSYAYIGKEVSPMFLDCLTDEDLLQTLGYAFLLGLMGNFK